MEEKNSFESVKNISLKDHVIYLILISSLIFIVSLIVNFPDTINGYRDYSYYILKTIVYTYFPIISILYYSFASCLKIWGKIHAYLYALPFSVFLTGLFSRAAESNVSDEFQFLMFSYLVGAMVSIFGLVYVVCSFEKLSKKHVVIFNGSIIALVALLTIRLLALDFTNWNIS
jgi:hypothetical protein